MTAATVTVRYDGPILAEHRMDVADLAPALLGVSELCKIANRKFNGDKAAVKVLIGTDVEHQCFQIDLHVVQSVWDSAKSLLANDDVGTAKNLLEWLGLLGVSAGGIYGLFPFLKSLSGKKISETSMEVKEGRDVVRVTFDGDSHNNSVVFVFPQTLEMLRDENALSNAKKVIQPVTREGYDKVEFEGRNGVTETIGKEQATAIASITQGDLEASSKDEPQTITAWVTVYSPVYDVSAPKWRFKFGGIHEYMDISETTIAAQAVMRGAAMIDDAYRVKLEITQVHTPTGAITNVYKIKEVLEFKPAKLPYQTDAFRGENSN